MGRLIESNNSIKRTVELNFNDIKWKKGKAKRKSNRSILSLVGVWSNCGRACVSNGVYEMFVIDFSSNFLQIISQWIMVPIFISIFDWELRLKIFLCIRYQVCCDNSKCLFISKLQLNFDQFTQMDGYSTERYFHTYVSP